MEIRQLRYFVAVAEEQHFHRAAERLGIAQPALSRWVAALEKSLDVKLFDRVGRGVRLSHAGRTLLADAYRLLDDIGLAKHRVRMVAQGQVGMLRLAFCEPGAGYGMMPDVVRAFRESEPNVELSLWSMTSDQQVEAIRTGQIDGGFLYRLDDGDAALEYKLLAKEAAYVAAPRTHRFANRQSIRLAELGDDPLLCIARSVNPTYHERLSQILAKAGLSSHVAQFAHNSEVILSLVAVGMGLGVVSSSALWRPQHDIALIRLKERKLEHRFEFAFRRQQSLPAISRFVRVLADVQRRSKMTGRRERTA